MLNSTDAKLNDAELPLDATLASTSALSLPNTATTALVMAEIEQALAAAWCGKVGIEAVAVTGSTNEDLALRARAHQPAVCVLRAADFQSGGRGRHQRVWHAAPGDALLFSVAVPIACVPQSQPAITLACGVALAECFAAHGVAVELKWPNDIRVNQRKLGGILTELVLDRDARRTLVIGVGINLRLDAAARHSIGQPAVALDQLLQASIDIRREHWLGQLGSAILTATEQFVSAGFEPFRARYSRLLEAHGELVDVIDGDKTTSGCIVGVDRSGRLIIESDGVTHSVSVGDVSVRLSHR